MIALRHRRAKGIPVGCLSRKGSCGLVQGPEMSVEMAWATAVAGHVGATLNQLMSSGLPAVYFKPENVGLSLLMLVSCVMD